MTESDLSNLVLKRDALGRVQSTAAQRALLLEAFERSGLSGSAFASVAGINYHNYSGG